MCSRQSPRRSPGRAAEFVDPDKPPLVAFDASLLQPEVAAGGPPSDRDHQAVHLEPVHSVRILEMYADRIALRVAAGDPLAQADVETLSTQDAKRVLRDVPIGRGQEVFERFQQHHLGAEPIPDAPELEADDPGPDDAESTGRVDECESALGIHDALSVDRRRGKGGGDRAGRDDDVPGAQHPAGKRPLPRPRRRSSGGAVPATSSTPFLRSRAGDPAPERRHHPALAGLHGGHVDPRPVHRDPVAGQKVRQVVEVVGGVEQGLRRMHPTLRQVPPRAGRPRPSVHFSMHTVRRWSWAQRIAAT